MNKPMIELVNVSKNYQRGSETVHAVKGISLAVNPGDSLAIVGHSGSGKTTLLNLMGCLDRPSHGHVRVNGEELSGANEAKLSLARKRSIGFVFQQFFLIPTLTVRENVELPVLFSCRESASERAVELLKRVGLGHRLDHLPGQLSGGEMQRVAVARSLINDPPIILADEPTGNLDSRNSANIMDIFQEIHQEGRTLVVVTHNPELVKRTARVIRIEDGVLEA